PDGTLKRHEAGGERFYAVPEERRITLDYHKNGILHFLVAPAILAAALRSFRGKPAPHGELLGRARAASRLLKYEFIFPPGKSLESTVDENFGLLLRWGLVERVGEQVQPLARGVRMLAPWPSCCARSARRCGRRQTRSSCCLPDRCPRGIGCRRRSTAGAPR